MELAALLAEAGGASMQLQSIRLQDTTAAAAACTHVAWFEQSHAATMFVATPH
jgi:hypothetical protein